MASADKLIARLLKTRAYRQLCGQQGFDLFSLLDDAVVENSWSVLLAFLCDSGQKHALGLEFFQEWQDAIEAENKRLGRDSGLKIPRRGIASSRTHFQWTTPEGRILDVLIELLGSDGRPRCVIGIENKRGAAEQADQLRDCQRALRQVYPHALTAILFLTPDGAAPTTAVRMARCPCLPVSYRTVTDACGQASHGLAGDIRLLLMSMKRHLWERPVEDDEMREDARLRKLVNKLHNDPKHRLAVRTLCEYAPSLRKNLSFFEEQVLDGRDNMPRNKPEGQIYFFTYPRSAMNPRELQVYIEELDSKTEPKGFQICFMLHANDQNPDVGSEFTLRVMAWCETAAARQRARKLSGSHKDKNPARQWDNWESIWVGDTYRLKDLSKKNAGMLAGLLNKGLRESYGHLVKAASRRGA